MTTIASYPAGALEVGPAEPVFSRVVVGVDGTQAAFDACRQVARLAEHAATVDAVAVVHLADAVHTGVIAPVVADELQREAEEALEEATRILGGGAAKRFVNGYVTAALLREVERAKATLLALGSHGHHRATEILIGGPAGELLHKAPCSVLLARPVGDTDAFPRSIAVGLDGSAGADAALAAASELATRLGSRLRVVTALRGKDVDLAHVRLRAPLGEKIDEHPVEALVRASREADLLVVGSRGLHGLRALGSVSERVAHQAACSVLVVRPRVRA
jgi:nucleotide-binding universal stress UspA family protein